MAELNISERQVGDVTVLDMDGKITIGEGSVALRTAIRRLLEEGKKKILLNLARVGYIDSSGIGELVSSYTAIGKEEGPVEASQSHPETARPFDDHETADCF